MSGLLFDTTLSVGQFWSTCTTVTSVPNPKYSSFGQSSPRSVCSWDREPRRPQNRPHEQVQDPVMPHLRQSPFMEWTFGEHMTERLRGSPAGPASLRLPALQDSHLQCTAPVLYVFITHNYLATSYARVLIVPSCAATIRASTSAVSLPSTNHEAEACLSVPAFRNSLYTTTIVGGYSDANLIA